MPSPKRRFLSADAPTPQPISGENPFRKVIAAGGILLVLVMSVPMFADAVYGQSVPSNATVDQTSNLISALTMLSSQIGLLKNDVNSLRSQLAAGGATRTEAGGTGSVIDTTMADCLQSCRSKLAVCLTRQASSSAANAPLDACRSNANNCMNACRPRTETTIGCEDRCAVALGGCVVQAGDSAEKLTECRTKNRECVVAACRPRADRDAPSRVPVEICRDQCNRDAAICQKAAAYDREELAVCAAVAQRCLTNVCNSYEVRSTAPFTLNISGSAASLLNIASPALGGTSTGSVQTNTAPNQQATVACESSCTSMFQGCSAQAGRVESAQATCTSNYGICRDNCRAAVGGGDSGVGQ